MIFNDGYYNDDFNDGKIKYNINNQLIYKKV